MGWVPLITDLVAAGDRSLSSMKPVSPFNTFGCLTKIICDTCKRIWTKGKMDSDDGNLSESLRTQFQVEKDDTTLPLEAKQLGIIASEMIVTTLGIDDVGPPLPKYRLYKRRFIGALGIFMLDFLGGFNVTWYGPISNNASQYLGQSLDRINWLGNVVLLFTVLSAAVSPSICHRFGPVMTCFIGVIPILIGVWLRYAGATPSISGETGYSMMFFSQVLIGLSQPVFQIVAVRYSESWFDLKSRTTFTLLISLGNPVGAGVSQLISPIGDFRTSLLISAIISTALAPFVLIVRSEPPIPPTYSGSLPCPSIRTFFRALSGTLPRYDEKGKEDVSYMTRRERLDFLILTAIFSTFVAAITAFETVNAQILQPYGYSSATAGFVTAASLLSGLFASIIMAPIFDRVFTHHLGIAIRAFVPIVALGWLSLIWAVRENNAGAIYAVTVIIGIFSINLLPVGLELGVELTRNANVSAAILWGWANLLSVIFVIVESALRDGSDASPPLNMRRALIFMGAWCMVVCASAFFVHGKQARRERDLLMAQKAEMQSQAVTHNDTNP